jgi:LmbE family N-acetylglucosaminyl deacetylase
VSPGAGAPWTRRLYYAEPFQRAVAGGADRLARRLEHRATDITTLSRPRSAVVLAPHPDDETLGCGGTIALKRLAGTRVTVVVVTDGRYSQRSACISADRLAALRRAEAVAACAVLGVDADDVVFLDHEEGSLHQVGSQLVAQLVEVLDALRPAELLSPSGIDRLADHRNVCRAARRAVAACRQQPSVLEYPVWLWDAQAWIDRDAPALRQAGQLLTRPVTVGARLRPVAVGVGAVRDRKRAALDQYRSQLTNLTGEPTWATMDPRFIERFMGHQELFFPWSPT